MPTSPLTRYLTLQRAVDTDVLRALQTSAAVVESELRRLTARSGVGALVRTQQLLLSQQAIQQEMSRYWAQVGDTTRAAMADAAAVAADTMIDRDLLSNVFGAADVDYLTRSAQASARQALSTLQERVSGSSYIPLAESVYDNAALTSGKVDDLINSAIARGASASELARDVRDFVNPNTPGGVRYASMRLARTELNNAFHASQVRQAQKNPWTTAVKWNLSGSHPVPDECNEYADSTHFTGGEAGQFRPMEVPAKPHPNCLCFTTPEDVSRDEFVKQFESGEYDTYLEDLDLPAESIEDAVAKITNTVPNRVGSDTLKNQMLAAERQRQTLESTKFIQKGKGKGNYNPEMGYTPNNAKALNQYVEGNNADMNLLKRDPLKFAEQEAGDPSWVDYIGGQNDALEDLLSHNSLGEDVTVARFMRGDFGTLSEGQYMADPGFLSTTTDLTSFVSSPSQAFGQSAEESWTFIIRVPKGTNAVPGADYQKEIVLGPGTKQRILEVDRGTRTVYTEVVN